MTTLKKWFFIVMENNTQETMSRCKQYNEKKNKEINRENS